MTTPTSSTRLEPLAQPYSPDVAETLRRMMPPGVEPLQLFRTVAHNPAILERLRTTGAYILNFGQIEPAEREIVIHRATARCGCEYEWGVHAAFYGPNVGLAEEQLRATVHGTADDPVWSRRQALLIRLVDELHDTARVSDEVWAELAREWEPAQLVELVATVGFYHFVSFTANTFAVKREEYAARFPAE
jgi:4-carboxymuconolactone decarboxylase